MSDFRSLKRDSFRQDEGRYMYQTYARSHRIDAWLDEHPEAEFQEGLVACPPLEGDMKEGAQ